MQIPSSLRPFLERTLIVITDTLKAKIFLASGLNITGVGTIDVTSGLEQESGDREAIKIGGGRQPIFRSNDEYGTKKEHMTKDHFYNALNSELLRRRQNHEFDSLVFTVPEELKNELKESLDGQLLKRTKSFIPKNLMKEDLLDVVAIVQEIPEG